MKTHMRSLQTDAYLIPGGLTKQLLSADVQLLSADVQLLSADVQLLSADVQLLSADVQLLSADVQLLSADVQLLSADESWNKQFKENCTMSGCSLEKNLTLLLETSKLLVLWNAWKIVTAEDVVNCLKACGIPTAQMTLYPLYEAQSDRTLCCRYCSDRNSSPEFFPAAWW